MNKRNTNNIRRLTMTAMLSAISALLMLLDFPLPIFPPFIKMDFSDLPAMIAAFSLNPLAGVTVELIKNLVNILLTGTDTGFIGEFANFIIGSALVFPAGLVYRKYRNKKGAAAAGMLVGTISMTIIGALANYFVLIPFYTTFMPLETMLEACKAVNPAIDSVKKLIIFGITPFNILKGSIVSVITFFLYKRIAKAFNR